jgi:hypothetical protein
VVIKKEDFFDIVGQFYLKILDFKRIKYSNCHWISEILDTSNFGLISVGILISGRGSYNIQLVEKLIQ